MEAPLVVAALAGSLRRDSLNRGLLRAAAEAAPEGVEVRELEIGSLPLYSEDLDSEGAPAAVLALREAVRAADAVLIATPEYNGSVPAALKNAIDWVSRPRRDATWNQKPVAIMGATPGQYGTAWAQDHLRRILSVVGADVLGNSVQVAGAWDLFDGQGNLTDEPTRLAVAELLQELAEHADRLSVVA
ncbi:MAG: NADPH-dependent FMN reductase [Candidatus Dormibacteria bacterium]